jgi:hypothetical protein
MPPILQIQVQRAPGDCAIAALSTYLGMPYEDVLVAAVRSTRSGRVHHHGLSTAAMRATAKRLGHPVTLHRAIDLEQDEGVLSVGSPDRSDQHAVVLKAGLIFDGDGTVWEPEPFFAHYRYQPISLLVREDE